MPLAHPLGFDRSQHDHDRPAAVVPPRGAAWTPVNALPGAGRLGRRRHGGRRGGRTWPRRRAARSRPTRARTARPASTSSTWGSRHGSSRSRARSVSSGARVAAGAARGRGRALPAARGRRWNRAAEALGAGAAERAHGPRARFAALPGPTPDLGRRSTWRPARRRWPRTPIVGSPSDAPSLRAAARAVNRSEAALDVAKREANLPSFMVGADYWYMPTQAAHNAYGAMVSMSLPWLNPRHRDEVKAAEQTSAAERSALRAQQAVARFQLRDADAKLRAARETLALIHDRVLADARRSFESAQASFQSGHGDVTPVLDGARNYLQVRIEEVRALADLESSRADYARAAGSPVVGITESAPRKVAAMSGPKDDGRGDTPGDAVIPAGVGAMAVLRWGARLCHGICGGPLDRLRDGSVGQDVVGRRSRRARAPLLLPDASLRRAGPSRRVPDLQHDARAQAWRVDSTRRSGPRRRPT